MFPPVYGEVLQRWVAVSDISRNIAIQVQKIEILQILVNLLRSLTLGRYYYLICSYGFFLLTPMIDILTIHNNEVFFHLAFSTLLL